MMQRAITVCGILAIVFSLAIYRQLPTYPDGLELSHHEKINTILGTCIYRFLLTLESFGLINDSAISFRQISHISFPDFLNNPSYNSDVESRKIAGIPVLIFRPPKEKPHGTLIYFHGGAFSFLSPSTHFLWTKMLALQADVVVISVDYRLAPENPYPAGIEDCLKVTKAVFDEAGKFSIDPSRIMVGGESAGGTFAALVAIELASSPKYRLKGQLLLSPALQALEILPSMKAYGYLLPFSGGWALAKYAGLPYSNEIMFAVEEGRFRLTSSDKGPFERYLNVQNLQDDLKALRRNETIGEHFAEMPLAQLSDLSESVRHVVENMRDVALDEKAWPLLTMDDEKLRQMCPIFLSIGEFDPLRDEELLYYDRLRSIGAKVSLSFMHGIGHAGPVVPVITRQPVSDSIQTKYIPDIIEFITNRMLSVD